HPTIRRSPLSLHDALPISSWTRTRAPTDDRIRRHGVVRDRRYARRRGGIRVGPEVLRARRKPRRRQGAHLSSCAHDPRVDSRRRTRTPRPVRLARAVVAGLRIATGSRRGHRRWPRPSARKKERRGGGRRRMSARIDVGVLGATGVVGQQIVARLARHPWFRVAWLGASERSVGRRYGDLPWRAGGVCPPAAARLSVEAPEPRHAPSIVFSALDAATASTLEPQFAASGRLVASNASAHRMRPDVPLIVPAINPHDIRLVEDQPWSGSLITTPSCSSVFLALALAPLVPFGLRAVTVSTLQALSGAGYPGVASLDALANVVPFIAGEEEKL